MTDELAKLVAEFCRDIPKTSLISLTEVLHEAAPLIDDRQILNRLPTARLRRKLKKILALADEGQVQLDALRFAIEAAGHAHEMRRQETSLEMVWTGPSPPSTLLRRTDQALLEVIKSAQSRLWIVSFAAYRVKAVIAEIDAACTRGVKVNLILESTEESQGGLSNDQIDEIQQALPPDCRFYVWPLESREPNEWGKRGVLHAKCALADGQQLFISSANLTEAALTRNIELGILIKNRWCAEQTEHHLRWLVESKTFTAI